jgi:hypothetical protein
MAKLFLVSKIVRVGWEIHLSEHKYYQIVAVRRSDLEHAKFYVDLEPFPHYVFAPDPDHIWQMMKDYGVSHFVLRLLNRFPSAPAPTKRLTSLYFTDLNFREDLHNKLNAYYKLGDKRFYTDVIRFKRIKDDFYFFIRRIFLKGQRIKGFFGDPSKRNPAIAVRVGLAEKVPLEDVLLNIKATIGKHFISKNVWANDYFEFYYELVKKALAKKTTLKNYDFRVKDFDLAHPEQLLIPDQYEITKRKKELARYYEIAKKFAEKIHDGTFFDWMLELGLEPQTYRSGYYKKPITAFYNWRNVSMVLAKMKFSFRASQEIWDFITRDFSILPNPRKK